MDRIETDAVTDANGDVHVHVGVAGARVHVRVDATSDDRDARRLWMAQVYGSLADVQFEAPPQLPVEQRDSL